MRRFLVLLIASFFALLCYAQGNTARVILKNGTTYSGRVVELNPQSHITLLIAGIETRIDISDVESIEDASMKSTSPDDSQMPSSVVIKEKKEEVLPESYSIEIGPYKINMVLVKGSIFSMGYDGKGSRSMNSEPVHDVEVSDFYVNRAPLEKGLVALLTGSTKSSRKSDVFYHPASKTDADQIVSRIAAYSNLPIKLITEAQWEYLATHKTRISIFNYIKSEQNFCSDSYKDYSEGYQKDPCPKGGPYYVIRHLLSHEPDRVYHRYSTRNQTALSSESAIRLTFPASALIDK